MKISLLILLVVLSTSAMSMRIFNFNTMCDICSGSSMAFYSQRLKMTQSLIVQYSPDLISLQELRSYDHVDFIFKKFPMLTYLPKKNEQSYTDTIIAFNHERFDLINSGTVWLGPNSNQMNNGWGFSLPRYAIWAQLRIKNTNEQFIFVGSHFDNLRTNLSGSAKLMAKFFQSAFLPVIFAGDTNITSDMNDFKILSKNMTVDHDYFSAPFQTEGGSGDDKSLCYHRKGETFPECKVEHVLFSRNSPWKFHNYSINTEKKFFGFPSDHRAFIIDLQKPSF